VQSRVASLAVIDVIESCAPSPSSLVVTNVTVTPSAIPKAELGLPNTTVSLFVVAATVYLGTIVCLTSLAPTVPPFARS